MISTPLQIALRVLFQYDQTGQFSTSVKEEIEAVGWLEDTGRVKASYKRNAADEKIVLASILRLTFSGAKKIKSLRFDHQDPTPISINGLDYSIIIQNAEEIRRQSAESYDSMIKWIAGGGLGVSLSVLSFFNGLGRPPSIVALIFLGSAVLLWVYNLIVLLVLAKSSQSAMKKRIQDAYAHKIYTELENKRNDKIDERNIKNGIALVLGIICFTIFVLLSVFQK